MRLIFNAWIITVLLLFATHEMTIGSCQFKNIGYGKLSGSFCLIKPTENKITSNNDTIPKRDSISTDSIKTKKRILPGVTIKGKRFLIIQNVDRSVIKVENNELFVGSNLEEILEKVPGIIIDANNRLIINGTNSVKFQINGRDVPINANSITLFLKSIQSSAIKSIEIINPSAKTDAQSSAKILNINTLQPIADGYTISPGITYSQGDYARTGVNLFAQVKMNKFSLQLLSFADVSDEYSKGNSSRLYQGGSTLSNNEKDLNNKKSYFNKLDINYTLDKQNIFGLSYYNSSSHQNNTINSIYDFASSGHADSSLLNTSFGKQNLGYSLFSGYYKHTFDTTSHFIIFDVDLNKATNKQNYLFLNQLLFSEQNDYRATQENESQSNSQIWLPSAYINYSKPLLKNSARLDLGVKYTLTKDDENYNSQNNFTNDYSYRETVTAGYLSFLYEKKEFSFQGGLRGENTGSSGNIDMVQVSDKNYFNLFPSISIQRKFHNDDVVISVNYRKRIQRPTFLALSPFIYFTSPYDAFRGDATLSPTMIDEYSASVTIKGLYINCNYSKISNMITILPFIASSLSTVINQYTNIGTEDYRAINASYPFTFKMVSFTPSVNAEYSSNYLSINSEKIEKTSSDIFFNLSGVYKYSKTGRFEIKTFYVPKIQTIATTVNHKTGVTLRYIKTFLKGNLSFRAAAEDIFNGNKESGSNNLAGYVGTFSNFYDNRRLSLSLTYTLRKGQRVSMTPPGNENNDNNNRIKNQ